MAKIDANDPRIRVKINELLAEAQTFYSKGFTSPPTRSVLLESAWSTIQRYRESSGANDTISVCAEHYLLCRWKSSIGVLQEVGYSLGAVAYVGKMFVPKSWLRSDGKNDPSDYEFNHTIWESKGIQDGILDRGKLVSDGKVMVL